MPYSDPEQQREYQRRWLAQRRDAWLSVHGPCVDCGTWLDLTVDHKDRRLKVSHRIWSWSEERRDLELAKCQVLCVPCHKKKTQSAGDHAQPGETNSRSKLSNKQASALLLDRKTGMTYRSLGEKYDIDYRTAWDVVNRGWKHVQRDVG